MGSRLACAWVWAAPVGLFLCAVAGFEFYVLYSTERLLRSEGRPSAAQRYGYAFPRH